MILAMGICYGGLAQIVAGMMEWRKGNTFATTAFVSYGFFWLSLVALIVLTKLGWAVKSDDTAMAAYLAMWGLFTGFMFIGTLRLNRALQMVFGKLSNSILPFSLTKISTPPTPAGFQTFHRLRGNLLRFLRDLRRSGAGAQRVVRQDYVATGAGTRVILSEAKDLAQAASVTQLFRVIHHPRSEPDWHCLRGSG